LVSPRKTQLLAASLYGIALAISNFATEPAKPGLDHPDVTVVSGSALRFGKKNVRAVFYQGDKNVPFRDGDWTGTISFWLNLNPDQDLEPGFCDPIQVTDKAYNDSAIWVDFTL